MTAQIIDGKQVAADMREELKNEVAKLKEKGIVPVADDWSPWKAL